MKYPSVEWDAIVNLRNIAAHNYWGLRWGWIWKIVIKDVPELLEQVEEIVLAEGVDTDDDATGHR